METVVHISPLFRTKGGISTVVANYLTSDLARDYRLFVIDSHTDGNNAAKIIAIMGAFAKACVCVLFYKPSLVHVHMGDFPSPYRKAILCLPFRLRRVPSILHFHGAGFMSQYEAKGAITKNILRSFFASFTAVLCLSESWKNILIKTFDVTRITVVPNAVPLPDKQARGRDLGGALRLLFLGLIGTRKGVFELLDAVEVLVAEGYNIEVAVGGNGDIEALRVRMKNERLKGRVRYLGWVEGDEREQEFLGAHLFVLPSHAEGMPMSVLEAMSYGLPIVSTRVGGIPELVENNANGMLVEPGNSPQLVQAIRQLADDEALRQKMGKRSREIIEQRFSLAAHIEAIKKVYRDCLRR
jgi:glycosyltransferase involved in cell wall biosynthesis